MKLAATSLLPIEKLLFVRQNSEVGRIHRISSHFSTGPLTKIPSSVLLYGSFSLRFCTEKLTLYMMEQCIHPKFELQKGIYIVQSIYGRLALIIIRLKCFVCSPKTFYGI
jgi:hypothetical protein